MVVFFSYTNGAYEFSVKFCDVKFSSFYFDESMSSIGGYEPYISWSTVDITPI